MWAQEAKVTVTEELSTALCFEKLRLSLHSQVL